MIKHWKINNLNSLSEFIILNKDSIWISKINENEISIAKAIEEKKLFGKTNFYRFSELESIVFDEDNFDIILNYQADDEGKNEKAVTISIPKNDYNDIQNHISQIFTNKPLKDLSFFDKEKPIILSVLTTIGIGIFMLFTIGLSVKHIAILLAITIFEVFVLKALIKTPKKGKILKFS
jgi:hypothetical protein